MEWRSTALPKSPMDKAVRDALIAFMTASAEAQAEASKEAQRDGIAYAKRTKENVYRGRKPSFTREAFGIVRDMLRQGASVVATADATKLNRQSVYLIRDAVAGCEAALARWETR
jgi:putative DNA-invertase from lambdoid prophage Rac